jgi:hypothetical protein
VITRQPFLPSNPLILLGLLVLTVHAGVAAIVSTQISQKLRSNSEVKCASLAIEIIRHLQKQMKVVAFVASICEAK